MTIFLATELTAGEATPMEDERIETRWFSARQVESMILSNKIRDSKTMIGYFVWKNGKR
jgi:ADP-ribose pyrophosphatase